MFIAKSKPLGLIVWIREREDLNRGGKKKDKHSSSLPNNSHHLGTQNRWGQSIIIQLPLLTVNNAQPFHAHNRKIIGNQIPGDILPPYFHYSSVTHHLAFMWRDTCHVLHVRNYYSSVCNASILKVGEALAWSLIFHVSDGTLIWFFFFYPMWRSFKVS